MSAKNFFQNFKSEAPEYKNLAEVQDHPVRLVRAELTDSRTQFDGTEKENLPDYVDATEQLACVFVSAEGKGSIVHRFNGTGFTKYDELTAEQKKSDKIINIDGYACVKKGEDYVRIQSEERTKACQNILNNVFDAFQIPAGSGMESLNDVIEERRVALITITKDEYQGKEQYRVARLKKMRKAVATDEQF